MSIRIPNVVTIDFETKGIQKRPLYPPVPVGVALREPSKRPRYLAWGHPTENNCTKEHAQNVLRQIWVSNKVDMLFHNAKFDIEVATEHMGVEMPEWHRVHDTMYLLFLHDPHAKTLGLKESAEKFLGMEPQERDEVMQWLHEKGIIARLNQKDRGAYIAEAPGELVGRYAVGDVVRTYELFQKLYPEIVLDDMLAAYDRERRVMPILLRNEKLGIRVDHEALDTDFSTYIQSVERADDWLRKRLKSPELNINSDQTLADALETSGVVTEWNYTAPSTRNPNGVRSVAKGSLTPDMFKDPAVYRTLAYRNRLSTCLGTFMSSWLETANESGGVIFTNWNQVRSSESGGLTGARTGRMSSNPNFQNIPKAFEGKGDGYEHPKHIRGLPELPLMRKYILPDKGHVFCHRDYNQQELRILAHFDNSTLMAKYNEDPRLDIHTYVQEAIEELTGLKLTRGATKVLNFGVVYGMGLGKLAAGMKVDVQTARRVKDAQMRAIPGLKELTRTINRMGKEREPISTWGGRLYYTEPSIIINGRTVSFEYKLLNYLIQGSAADCTKEAIIRYDDARENGRFLVTVHDEINLSVPARYVKREMFLLKQCMQSVEFDVPMLSDGKTGPSWGELSAYKE